MQALLPSIAARNPNGHTEDEIREALEGRTGARTLSFRYEHLTAGLAVIDSALPGVGSCKVTNNWLADIKRTMEMVILDQGSIDFLQDKIKPYVRLHLPPYGTGDWVEWPQGVFLLSTPRRKATSSRAVIREVTGYDQLKIFSDEAVADRYTAAAGAVYTTVVSGILGSTVPKNVVASAATLLTAREWEPGTSKLRIINDLLAAINYDSLSFDEEGVAQAVPYVDVAVRPEAWTYDTGQRGLIVPDVGQEVDLFDVANQWVLVVSDPDRPTLRSVRTNNDPASPTSTVRRQRTISDFRTEQDAPDQATLDAKTLRLAQEASQVYETVPFSTALMPIHGSRDVYRLSYPDLSINAKYVEHAWSMTFAAGASMEHTARRVLVIS